MRPSATSICQMFRGLKPIRPTGLTSPGNRYFGKANGLDEDGFCFKRKDFSVTFSFSDISDVEHFVARTTELAKIQKELSSDGSRRVVILYSLGGIGKTQLAVAYAKRHKDDCSGIFWLNIKDEDSLKQSFFKVAKQILREHPLALRLSNVETIENLDKVLIIYDNYNNPKLPGKTDPAAVDIRKYLPESYQGLIIITTRSSQVKNGHVIHVRKLEKVRDSLEILSNVSKRKGLIDDPDAIKLARELDGLPLALATAGAYLDQVAGKLVEAEQMYQRALQGFEKAWGPDYTSTLRTVNNLGLLYADQGKLVEAEQMYQRALEPLRRSRQAGRGRADGKLVEAEQMYQRALQGKEKAWGPDHTSTLSTVNNLAALYKNQGKLVEAEQMYQRALQGFEKAWGPDYTSALESVNNLGNLYVNQGKLVEAEQMYQRALQGFEKGKLVEAEQMYQRALQGFENTWGPDHTSTLSTVNNLGILYADQGKLVEAEQMYQRAL
ncbi:TPR-like protein [Cadophora sp. DSE1049]|nr:TPR-like protein [Cadophora sp. DSE1049]